MARENPEYLDGITAETSGIGEKIVDFEGKIKITEIKLNTD